MTLIDRLENDLALSGEGSVPVRASDVRALIAAYREARAQAEGMAEFAALKMEERDAAEAKLKALREAAGALLEALGREVRPCGVCFSIATWAEPFPRGGSAYRCDQHHKHDDPDGEGICSSETKAAAPLRALRAALETKP